MEDRQCVALSAQVCAAGERRATPTTHRGQQSNAFAPDRPTPSAQGLLLPLCASRTCTLREAVIFTSVLKRTSIPVLHSAAALLRMVGSQI